MEAEQSQDRPSAWWRTRKACGVFWRLESQRAKGTASSLRRKSWELGEPSVTEDWWSNSNSWARCKSSLPLPFCSIEALKGSDGDCSHWGSSSALIGPLIQMLTSFRNTVTDTCMRLCPASLRLQSCLTLCDPVDCSPPGFSVHGISQPKILECVAMPSSGESSWPRDQTHIS